MNCIGHTAIREALGMMLKSIDSPQSFLFAGPRHVGKRTVAEWFAGELAGIAERDTLRSDILILEPARIETAKRMREQTIPVELIREAQKFLSRSPVGGRRRVLIIDGAEKLGIGAANALLKLLEEPMEKTSIILITAEPGSLLPTILSRVVTFHFRPVSGEIIKQAVPEAAALPQFFTDLGLPGIVLRALAHGDEFSRQKDTLRQLFQLSKLSWHERLALAEELARDEIRAREVLEIWCTGLVFQARQKTSSLVGHYAFLEQLLRSLKSLSKNEGAGRPVLEKLFFSL